MQGKFLKLLLCCCLLPFPRLFAGEIVLPAPGTMVHLSPAVEIPILKGIKVHSDDPFRLEFVLDSGNNTSTDLKEESNKLIKYFLASLTTPDKDMWVNLSPYEKDRIIPDQFGQTQMGRDLLAQDYILKQITASLIYPEDTVGREFWRRVYQSSANKNIPVKTFNKVWIVPDKAVVYENAKAGAAYVVESSLKVLTEQDYLASTKNNNESNNNQIIKDVVIPQLTKEINTGANFAQLRQVYNALILATWYKKKIQDSILNKVYSDKHKIHGATYEDTLDTKLIYARYLEAFKKGAYNYIKEDTETLGITGPRKYFSGGFNLALSGDDSLKVTTDAAMVYRRRDHLMQVDVNLSGISSPSRNLSGKKVKFSEFVEWMNQDFDNPHVLSDAEVSSLAARFNIQHRDFDLLKKEGMNIAKGSYAFYQDLPKDGKLNVYLFRDAFGLYLADKMSGGDPLAMMVSKTSVSSLGLDGLDVEMSAVVDEIKRRMGLALDAPIPEEQYARFKQLFFKFWDNLFEHKSVGKMSSDDAFVLKDQDNLINAMHQLSAYANSIGITSQLVKTRGVRFIDTTMRGTLVLFMEAVVHMMAKSDGLQQDQIKTDSRMFYSQWSQALSALKLSSSEKIARMTEYFDYPIRFRGFDKNYTPRVEFRDPHFINKFIFLTRLIKSELLRLNQDHAQMSQSLSMDDISIIQTMPLSEAGKQLIVRKARGLMGQMQANRALYQNGQHDIWQDVPSLIMSNPYSAVFRPENKEAIHVYAEELKRLWLENGFDEAYGALTEVIAAFEANKGARPSQLTLFHQVFLQFLESFDAQAKAMGLAQLVVNHSLHLRFNGLHDEVHDVNWGSVFIDNELLIGHDDIQGALQRYLLSLVELSKDKNRWESILPGKDGAANHLGIRLKDHLLWVLVLGIDPSLHAFTNQPNDVIDEVLKKYWGTDNREQVMQLAVKKIFSDPLLKDHLEEINVLVKEALTISSQEWESKGLRSPYRFGVDFGSAELLFKSTRFADTSAWEKYPLKDRFLMVGLQPEFLPTYEIFEDRGLKGRVDVYLAQDKGKDLRPLYERILEKQLSLSPTGGIDLNASRMNLETQQVGEGIRFRLDEGQIERLKDMEGLSHVIIKIAPVTDLQQFLGIL